MSLLTYSKIAVGYFFPWKKPNSINIWRAVFPADLRAIFSYDLFIFVFCERLKDQNFLNEKVCP